MIVRPTRDLDAAIARLEQNAPYLIYRGSGKYGDGSIAADLAAVLQAVRDVGPVRPNEPPAPFDPDPESWESHCAGNRAGWHVVTKKEPTCWHCGSCGQWLRPRVLQPGGIVR
jgi:hypothetical protein